MILSIAILIGLLIGLIRGGLARRPMKIPELDKLWLVPLAFLPQFFAFYLRSTREWMPDDLASTSLITSQILLLWFVWLNRKQTGFWALGLGLFLNLLIISSNGGFMPINPNTVKILIPDVPAGSWEIGKRLGTGKDIVLAISDIRFLLLSDRYLLPDWFPYRVAFSVGDVLIALGMILFFGGMGAPGKIIIERMEKKNVPNILAR